MDEIKLTKWKERFEQEVKNIQVEYNAYFLNRKLQDVYTVKMDESHEWELVITGQLPDEIKQRLQQIFLSAKPEDSI